MDDAHHHHDPLDFGHHHHHDHSDTATVAAPSRARAVARFVLAGLIAAGAVLAACAIPVPAGTALVVTEFGRPTRVLIEPGLAWKLPTPIETTLPVDLRLRTTSTGLQDVGTRDGLRILVQAYVAWQVPAEPDAILRFVRATNNRADDAAASLRSLAGSALQVAVARFALADLVNTTPGRVRLDMFEAKLQTELSRTLGATLGIAVREVGIERLSLPDSALVATIARMRSERETVAAERTAAGLREAARIRAEATRDSRITVANAETEAAQIEADARRQAADIQSKAFVADPQLYTLLRSLDALGSIVGSNTRLVLRTDAAPFSALVSGPPTDAGK